MGGKYIQHQDWLNFWTFKYSHDRDHFVAGLHKSGVLKKSTRVSAKPSIAVLQFTNLSDDPDQQYFADGMTTTISGQLARIPSLQVKSGFNYDMSKTSPSQISRELGVGYLLGGSVQREGDRVRVFVEFTDSNSGEIKWADKFDRRGSKVIDIQDDVARAITGTLWGSKGRIREAEHEKLSSKPTRDFNAFDFILKGIFYKEKFSSEYNLKAHECFDNAISLDPGSAEALGWSAWIHIMDIIMGFSGDRASSLTFAYSNARNAIAIDPYSEIGHWALAATLSTDGDFDHAFAEYDKALEINPNNTDLLVTKGGQLSISGRFDEGIELILQGIDFNKHHPEWYFWDLGVAYFAANRLEEAIEAFNRMNRQNKDIRIYLAACYAQTGDLAEAQNQATELFRIDAETSLEEIAESHSNLSDDSLNLLMAGLNLAMDIKKPLENLRIV
jgi:adenylate cyclase